MPLVNGVGYNIGTDMSVVVSDDHGDVFPLAALGHVMDVETSADDTELKVIPISNGGIPLFQTVWAGGHGKVTFTRLNGNLQRMVIQLMNAYHQVGLIPQFALSTFVLNRDGTVDEFYYTGVQWKTPRFGSFRALKEVDQSLDFTWSNCRAVGGSPPFLAALGSFA